MSTINYSKWDHIEISDDEDDTHPNIDTPSLFRWRHQARVEKMEEAKKEKETLAKEHSTNQQKIQQMKQKLKEVEEKESMDNFEKMKKELKELEKQESEYQKKEEELKKKEKLTPWNIDTICHEGKSKTIINKYDKNDDKDLTEEEKAQRQEEFTKKHRQEVKKYGMFSKYDDSQEYLTQHPDLVCEETANYLVLWCIDLEIEEKHSLMEQVAHQTIVMQFILELAKQMELDPRSCVRPFFSRIKVAQKEYLDAFNDELEGFKQRIRTRAKQKIDKAIKEHEEEERQKRLGPGGLDPMEVFDSLPDELKECFESKDIAKLQEVVMKMPKEDAEYHIKRCVDSGLWVPNAQDADSGAGEGAESKEEETYEEVD
ncbi:hsp90 co-chaperone Cdc37-like [Mercenaria mercenaria]|uniref:hsp90 co-chaperone Cdc37-like n=1 Tax=Mercenaria mercenaria TaxID=6596 RepID=UPI00234F8512|nr:hsp90 co-chaperone Cdc37-like [Mercenaria mercenaria]